MINMKLSESKLINSLKEAETQNIDFVMVSETGNFKMPAQAISNIINNGNGGGSGLDNGNGENNGGEGNSGNEGNTWYKVIDVSCALYDNNRNLIPFSTGATGADKFGNPGTYLGKDQNSSYIAYDYSTVIGDDTNIGLITIDATDKNFGSNNWIAFTNTPINIESPINSLKAAFFISAVYLGQRNNVNPCFSSTTAYKNQGINITYEQRAIVTISGGLIGFQNINANIGY